jgi:S1/P1 Nuclease
MMFPKIWWALALLVVLCGPAFAWGPEGHQVIGSAADQLLNDHAKQGVAQILGTSLRVASAWPDCARSVERRPDGSFEYVPNPRFDAPCTSFDRARLVDYVSRNWSNCTYEDKPTNCHKAFHFADVAIQHDDYERRFVGTSDHDVVSAINAAILVLQDKAAPAPFSIKDKKEALFLLAHFVGDIHQPLHVGAIYLNAAGALVNPDEGTFDKNSETAGGNSISEGQRNLHNDWDAIPKRFGTSADAAMVRKAKAVPQINAPLESWAAAWASDTVIASHTAFNGLSFTGTGVHKWSVEFDDMKAYVRAENSLKQDQLAKGGARLSQLLNAIWP